MGKRVHVAKRYEVEWGKTAAFNWNDETFIKILDALGGNIARDGEDGDYFDVGACSYYGAIENLKMYIFDPNLLSESDGIAAGLCKLGITAEELLDIMQRYREEADIHDGWLHFTSF